VPDARSHFTIFIARDNQINLKSKINTQNSHNNNNNKNNQNELFFNTNENIIIYKNIKLTMANLLKMKKDVWRFK